MSPTTPMLTRGSQVKEFLIERQVGQGGQAEVYLARDKQLEKNVALKVVDAADVENEERAIAEVRALARLEKHPAIMPVMKAGQAKVHDRELFYFAMRYVEGDNLTLLDACRARGLDQRRRLELFADVCDAMQYAHTAGFIHRDLKPSNILVEEGTDEKLRAIVTDFGIAWRHDHLLKAAPPVAGLPHPGTSKYMSPEQRMGRLIGSSSDVYTLAVILHELLTDKLPFRWDAGRQRPETVSVNGEPMLEVDPSLREDLRRLIRAGLEPIPEKRSLTAGDMRDAIQQIIKGGAPRIPGLDLPASFAWSVRAGNFGRRRPGLSRGLAIAAIALGVSLAVEVLLVPRSTPMARWWDVVLAKSPQAHAIAALSRVKVVDLTDPPVDWAVENRLADEGATEPPNRRVVATSLLEKLVALEPTAIVLDVSYNTSTDADMDRLTAVLEQYKSKPIPIPIIAGAKTWKRGPEGRPDLHPKLGPYARWGGCTGWFEVDAPWLVDMAIQRPGVVDPMLSVAAQTVGSVRHPDADIRGRLSAENCSLEIKYLSRADPRGIQLELYPAVRVALTDIHTEEINDDQYGTLEGDVSGSVWLPMPDGEALKGITMTDRSLLEALNSVNRKDGDPVNAVNSVKNNIAEAIHGRVVIIAPLNDAADARQYPGGRTIPAAYAHAVAIGLGLQETWIRQISGGWRFAIFAFFTAAAAVTAWRLAGSRRPLVSWGLSIALALVLIVIVGWLSRSLYYHKGLILEATSVAIAILLSCVLCAAWVRMWRKMLDRTKI